MPWTPKDASKKTKKAKSMKAKKQWSDVANSVLKRTGDDAQAVRTANGVVKKKRQMDVQGDTPTKTSSTPRAKQMRAKRLEGKEL